jgi:hypothetical protein
MRLVSPTSAFGALVRLVAAAALIAVIAVGAPLHSHDLVLGSDDGSTPQKAPCAACVTGSSLGVVSERVDVAPGFQRIGVVFAHESLVVAFSLPIRSGRAPPVA